MTYKNLVWWSPSKETAIGSGHGSMRDQSTRFQSRLARVFALGVALPSSTLTLHLARMYVSLLFFWLDICEIYAPSKHRYLLWAGGNLEDEDQTQAAWVWLQQSKFYPVVSAVDTKISVGILEVCFLALKHDFGHVRIGTRPSQWGAIIALE